MLLVAVLKGQRGPSAFMPSKTTLVYRTREANLRKAFAMRMIEEHHMSFVRIYIYPNSCVNIIVSYTFN